MVSTNQSSSHNLPDIDVEFRAQTNVFFEGWQEGQLSYMEAVQGLRGLLSEVANEGNDLHQGRIENLLGIMHGIRADYNQCIVHFEQARRFYERSGAFQLVAICDLNIGETYRLRGNFTRARMYFHRSYETGKQWDQMSTQANARANEGQMWLSLNSIIKAKQVLEEALELSLNPWQENEDENRYKVRLEVTCEIHYALVEIALKQDDLEDAWHHAKQSFEIGQTLQRPYRMGQGYRAIADTLTQLLSQDMGHLVSQSFEKDPDYYYRLALEAFREIKSESEVAKTIFQQGKSLAHRRKARRAAKLYQQAMVLFTRLGMTDDAAKAAEAQLDVI